VEDQIWIGWTIVTSQQRMTENFGERSSMMRPTLASRMADNRTDWSKTWHATKCAERDESAGRIWTAKICGSANQWMIKSRVRVTLRVKEWLWLRLGLGLGLGLRSFHSRWRKWQSITWLKLTNGNASCRFVPLCNSSHATLELLLLLVFNVA